VVCGRCRNCLAGRRHLCAHTAGVGVNRPCVCRVMCAMTICGRRGLEVPRSLTRWATPVTIRAGVPVRRDVLVTGAGLELWQRPLRGTRGRPCGDYGYQSLQADLARTCGMRAQVPPAGKTVATSPAHTCPSPLTRSPGWKSVTFEPVSTISPTNSCPITRPTDGVLRPRIPLVNVQVRAADACRQHADLHIVNAHLGLRHILNPQPAFRRDFTNAFISKPLPFKIQL